MSDFTHWIYKSYGATTFMNRLKLVTFLYKAACKRAWWPKKALLSELELLGFTEGTRTNVSTALNSKALCSAVTITGANDRVKCYTLDAHQLRELYIQAINEIPRLTP